MGIWLVGSGSMAHDYALVMKGLQLSFSVIGRGKESANKFRCDTGCPVHTGGIEYALQRLKAPKIAIVAVGVENLASVTSRLVEAGTKRILVEKPGALNLQQMNDLIRIVKQNNATVLVGYNRRFYSSVKEAKRLIQMDGGVLSANFEFTEWSHLIEAAKKKSEIKNQWVSANSSHVLDLVFHFIGLPRSWKSWRSGSLPWHPSAARFSGAGITDSDVIFSYSADWECPGRWGVELLTRKRRLILRPLEKLQEVHSGSTESMPVELDDLIDQQFKPGLYEQTKAFITSDDRLFCSLEAQARNVEIYAEIAGYES